MILVRHIVVMAMGLFVADWASASQSQKHLNMMDHVKGAIVEVIVPKGNDATEYTDSIPKSAFSYKERHDKYHSIGTAFFIGKRTLYSAAHIFNLQKYQGFNRLYIRTMSGGIHKIRTITRYDDRRDVAAFTIGGSPEGVTPLKFTKTYKVGSRVCVPGNARGEGISIRCNGELAMVSKEPLRGRWSYLRFSTPVSPGNSGGPLLDRKGRVLGIVTRKSPSENLNYGIPTSQILKLSKSYAQFYQSEIVIQENTGHSTKGAWSANFSLPKGIKALTSQARKSLNKKIKSIWKRHLAKHRSRLFPHARGLRRASLEKVNEGQLAYYMPRDYQGMNWSLRNINFRGLELYDGRRVQVATELYDGMQVFMIDRIRGKAFDLASKPQRIMDSFLQVNDVYRRVGRQSFKVKSYGQPYYTKNFNDRLGREWHYSRWKVAYNMSGVDMFCTPTPSGAACLVHSESLSTRSPIFTLQKTRSLNALLLNYKGNTEDVERFIANQRNIRFLGDFSLSRDSQGFRAKSKTLDIGFPHKAHNSDEWTLKVGFDLKNLKGKRLRGKLLGLSYSPRKKQPAQISFDYVESPGKKGGSPSARAEYTRILGEHAPYNGTTLRAEGGFAQFYPVGKETNRGVWVMGCVAPSEAAIDRMCNNISND